MISYDVETEVFRNKFEIWTPNGRYCKSAIFENILKSVAYLMNEGNAFEVHYIHQDGKTKIDVTDTFKLMI